MKRLLIFILAIITVLALVSCATAPAAQADGATGPRFTCEFQCFVAGDKLFILTDTQTGEQYLYINGDREAGITHLEDGT